MNERKWLEALQGRGWHPGLARMRALLRAAGNPQNAVPAVIVAGTNGKGSTAATLASIVTQAGYRCALYTSPHLVNLKERWRIDGRDVSAAELRWGIRELRLLARRTGVKPTYFEALTVIAFLLFRRRECDLTVLEVGMGGRLDATNVVKPLVSVITSISMDHMDFLGAKLADIAYEKAGVIHRGGIALTSASGPTVLAALRKRCRDQGVRLHLISRETSAKAIDSPGRRVRFALKTPRRSYLLASPLAGWHQLDNITLAVRAAEELEASFPRIDAASIVRGVAATAWRGRLEHFDLPSKLVLVDGGHNAGAAEALIESIRDLPRPRLLVFGIMRDKQVALVTRRLFPLFDLVVLTEPPSERSATVEDLAPFAESLGIRFQTLARPSRAFQYALESPAASVLIAGSLYLAGEAVKFLDRRTRARATRRAAAEKNQAAATRERRRPKRSSTSQSPGGISSPSRSMSAGKIASDRVSARPVARTSHLEK